MNEIDKAELIQAIKAFYIPCALFISCLLGAAGVFLLQEGYLVGWGFIFLSAVCIGTAFASFLTFQNKLRAKGLMKDQYDSPAPEFDSPAADETGEKAEQAKILKEERATDVALKS